MPIRLLIPALAALVLAACASMPSQSTPLAEGDEATFEGELASVDTAPWAYDGNARLTVDTRTHGRMAVELPARWNLCKAPAIGDAGALKPGERVRVTGTVTAPSTVTVCSQATHGVARLP